MPYKVRLLEFLRLEMADARERLEDHIIEHDCSISLTQSPSVLPSDQL